MEVDVSNIWDGKDTQTNKVAEYTLRFPKIDIPVSSIDTHKFLRDIGKELQPFADKYFGEGITIVQGVKVHSGSLEIYLILVVAGPTVYKFIKDYPSLRKGAGLFSKDVKAVVEKVEKLIRKHYIN